MNNERDNMLIMGFALLAIITVLVGCGGREAPSHMGRVVVDAGLLDTPYEPWEGSAYDQEMIPEDGGLSYEPDAGCWHDNGLGEKNGWDGGGPKVLCKSGPRGSGIE